MEIAKTTRLKRPRHPMPAFFREALLRRGLMDAYLSRPPYQRNDYIGWITQAVRKDTQQRRLDQMLNELESGEMYMNMAYRPKTAVKERTHAKDHPISMVR